MNRRQITKYLKDCGVDNVEITRFKGEYYVLHICKNNNPVPLFHSTDIKEVSDYIETNYKKEESKC